MDNGNPQDWFNQPEKPLSHYVAYTLLGVIVPGAITHQLSRSKTLEIVRQEIAEDTRTYREWTHSETRQHRLRTSVGVLLENVLAWGVVGRVREMAQYGDENNAQALGIIYLAARIGTYWYARSKSEQSARLLEQEHVKRTFKRRQF